MTIKGKNLKEKIMKQTYKINKTEELYALESMKDYKESVFYSPNVTHTKKVCYEVVGIKAEAENFISRGKVPIYCKTLKSYMQDKGLATITSEVIEEAIRDSNKFIKYGQRERDDGSIIEVSSDEEVVFTGDPEDEILLGAFKMFQKKYSRGTNFVKTLDKQRGVILEDYKYAYLYRHVGDMVKWSGKRIREPEEIAEENIAYRLKETIEDLQEDRNVDNTEGVLKYIQYLGEELNYSVDEALKIIDEVSTSHQIFEALSLEEIMVFLKTLDSDEVEYLDMDFIKEIKE